jgi:hypothetical protein
MILEETDDRVRKGCSLSSITYTFEPLHRRGHRKMTGILIRVLKLTLKFSTVLFSDNYVIIVENVENLQKKVHLH